MRSHCPIGQRGGRLGRRSPAHGPIPRSIRPGLQVSEQLENFFGHLQGRIWLKHDPARAHRMRVSPRHRVTRISGDDPESLPCP